MPRRKPASAKQRKAELQLKRAVKRGDLTPEAATHAASKSGRGGRALRGGRQSSEVNAKMQSSRRLQSAFIKLSPAFLEETKRKAATLVLSRPLPLERAVFGLGAGASTSSSHMPELTVMRRPKWNYEMDKKQVEGNEERLFKKWLDQTDDILQAWNAKKGALPGSSITDEGTQDSHSNSYYTEASPDEMPYAAPLFERNLEVWRQLWRVAEICQILLILLDSRCPLLHYPVSLHNYLSIFRPPRKVIFVLTKVDISGLERTSLWKEYLESKYPGISIVEVESYLEKEIGGGQGKRKMFEPHIPIDLRRNLVKALKAAHEELCVPPLYITSNPEKLASWQPSVKRSVDWDTVLNAGEDVILHQSNVLVSEHRIGAGDRADVDDKSYQDFVSIGIIGQPNVGKSSLLNALFGSHRVKASRTPGKTKHFQTLFWTNQIRLVDCPGLVFPNYVDMEMQVLGGILPVAQISAIPSCVFLALQHIPLEKIFGLQHPSKKDAVMEDKRTWREGMRPRAGSELAWTAMDVLTAFAEMKGWITAKAGRPDVNRAGNAILRLLAEGKIRWAFYPPDTDTSKLSKEDENIGIWIKGEENDDFDDDSVDDEREVSDRNTSTPDAEDSDGFGEAGNEDDGVQVRTQISADTGMFDALTLYDDDSAEDGEGLSSCL